MSLKEPLWKHLTSLQNLCFLVKFSSCVRPPLGSGGLFSKLSDPFRIITHSLKDCCSSYKCCCRVIFKRTEQALHHQRERCWFLGMASKQQLRKQGQAYKPNPVGYNKKWPVSEKRWRRRQMNWSLLNMSRLPWGISVQISCVKTTGEKARECLENSWSKAACKSRKQTTHSSQLIISTVSQD